VAHIEGGMPYRGIFLSLIKMFYSYNCTAIKICITTFVCFVICL